jgi:hypothetical protein
MAAPTLNHRRARHEVRRVLAELVVRGRDLNGSYFPEGFDLFDHQHRMAVNDNHGDLVVSEKRVADACQ